MKPARSYLLDRLIANGCIVEFTLEDSPDVAFLGNYVDALIAALCSINQSVNNPTFRLTWRIEYDSPAV